MTGGGTGKETWDDERLAAAYREAYDVTAPRDLEDRIVAAAARGARPRRPAPGWLRWSGAGASAIAAVAVVVVTVSVLVLNGLPTASPATSQGATESPSTGAPEPSTAGFPATIFGVDVLTVPEAIDVRDRGDATEIAVAGWYQQAGPVICPLESTQQPRLFEGCSLVTQWLMANPETLVPLPNAFIGGPTPSGPAIQPVFEGVEAGWGYPSSVWDAAPRPVVFVGHFHDARALDCPDENRRACSEQLVVDQVAWVDGAAYDAVFPADIDGIPVWTVEETIDRRDAGELGGIEVAIGGWYAESARRFLRCAVDTERRGPLEPYCKGDQEFVTDIPQVIDVEDAPNGTALWPRSLWRPSANPWPFGEEPQPVVLVGHFEDPLSFDCPFLGAETCKTFFVVDRTAWIDGTSLGPRISDSYFRFFVPVSRSAAQVARLVREQLPADGLVQSMTVLEGREVAGIDPIAGGAVEERGVVWYVRAVERGTNRVGSFIVDDATGELLWSDFPMGSIVVIAVP